MNPYLPRIIPQLAPANFVSICTCEGLSINRPPRKKEDSGSADSLGPNISQLLCLCKRVMRRRAHYIVIEPKSRMVPVSCYFEVGFRNVRGLCWSLVNHSDTLTYDIIDIRLIYNPWAKIQFRYVRSYIGHFVAWSAIATASLYAVSKNSALFLYTFWSMTDVSEKHSLPIEKNEVPDMGSPRPVTWFEAKKKDYY
jgi:hypothetical protein